MLMRALRRRVNVAGGAVRGRDTYRDQPGRVGCGNVPARTRPEDSPKVDAPKKIRARMLRLAAALVASMLAPAVQAQTYPSKTVTLVVPFPAGGSTDWLSRLLGQKLEQRLKQPFIVENRAGGANVIAATAVAKAEPDGHTLLMTTST